MHSSANHPKSNDAAIRSVIDDLGRIVQHLRVSSRHVEQRIGTSAAQLFVLSRLAAAWPQALSVKELTAQTLTDQSSVSVVVARLVQRKLVGRVRSREDGRRVDLTPTPKARTLLRNAPQTAQERFIAALKNMPEKRRHQLAILLHEFVAAVGDTTTPPELFFESHHKSRALHHGTRSRR